MPCLNEEETLAAAIQDALQAVHEKGVEGEVIVVNDGSTDNSQEIAEEIALSNLRVRILNKKKREGIGKAFWDGLAMATYPFVVMIPGDNENKVSEVLLNYHLAHQVDIVVPFIHNSEVRDTRRRFISSIYRLIINISFGTNLNYTNGTVVYNTLALRSIKLHSTGFFYQTELLVKLVRRGFLYAEVPQLLGTRRGGKSTALTLRSLCNLVWSFIRLLVDIHVLRIEGTRLELNSLPVGTNTRRRCLALKQ
jgi:glycosyltransferase involved in cell wall biosynthesis